MLDSSYVLTAAAIPLNCVTLGHVDEALPFIVQPIIQARNNEIFGYELLYRGPVRNDWFFVDCSALRYLALHKVQCTLFVNLSNDTILRIDERLLFDAAKKNAIYFEWSEQIADNVEFRDVVSRINAWSKQGLRFVIDDFGAGRDGFERLFAVDLITAIKFDGVFFRHAANNIFARKMVEHIVAECTEKNILTVGECVESESDFKLAQSVGLDFVQGFYIDDMYHRTFMNEMNYQDLTSRRTSEDVKKFGAKFGSA